MEDGPRSTDIASEVSLETPSSSSHSASVVPAFYQRRKRRGNEIGQVLLRNGDIKAETLRAALHLQEQQGGQIGRILVQMGACSERALAQALIRQLQSAIDAGKTQNLSLAAREHPEIAGLYVPCRPLRTIAVLLFGDLLSLCIAALLAIGLSKYLTGALPVHLYEHGLAIPILVASFAMLHLYSPPSYTPPEELRRTTQVVTLVFFGIALVASRSDGPALVVALESLSVQWAVSLLAVPLVRAVIRQMVAARTWWGHPVVVLGAGKTGRLLVRTLQKNPHLGLKPVALLDDDPAKHGTLRAQFGESDIEVMSIRIPLADTDSVRKAPSYFSEVEGVPLVGSLHLAPVLATRLNIRYAVMAMPGVESERLVQITEQVGGAFSHVLLIPDLFGFASLGVPARDLAGVLGLEVRQQLLLSGPRIAKRVIDLMLTIAGCLFIWPVLLTIGILVKLDSAGPIFYRQDRLGRDGRRFRAVKFRTMHGDGEKRLAEVLAKNPRLKAEYDQYHKLSRDPRVTRIGRVLRKYSMDELPQLFNVIAGDMSLVGPRPYLEREVPEMNHQEAIILRALPGITGMWQVSERNATTFEERLKMDVFYVRNWSPWLDVYLLARTLGVVVGGTGS
jgi:lipopolysaccharide/colanic/teichoic acid biosynthesis glycosyltransferase